jgi:hypothetical protein
MRKISAAEAQGFKAALPGPVGDAEPVLVHDIDQDRLVGAIVALSAELFVVHDKLEKLQRVLETSGALAPGVLDAPESDPALVQAQQQAAQRFAARILSELHRSSKPIAHVGKPGHDEKV